jgi:Bacterial membrane protein YfhO
MNRHKPETHAANRTSWSLAVELALTGFFTLWMAWPFLRTDRYVIGFDTVAYSGPNFAITRSLWGAGILPFWNDTIFGGVPLLANPQAAVLYLPKLLAFGTNTNRAMGWLVALHLLFLAFGMVLMARNTMRLSAPAGLIAGVTAVASGPMMVKAIQFEQIQTVAWAPWLILAAVALIRSARPWFCAGVLSLTIAGSILSGHPQMLYVIAPFVFGVSAHELVASKQWHRLKPLAVAVTSGLGLCAIQLGSTLMAAGLGAFSKGHAAGVVNNPVYSMDPMAFPQSLLGDMFAMDHSFTARNFEGVAFVGVGVALLALFAIVVAVIKRVRRGEVLALCGVAVASTWLALGSNSGLYRLAVQIVPSLDQARVPARFVVSGALSMAFLAAIGVHMMCSSPRRTNDSPLPPMKPEQTMVDSATVGVTIGITTILAGLAAFVGWRYDEIDLPPAKTALSWVLLSVGFCVVLLLSLVSRRTRRPTRNSLAPSIGVLCISVLVVAELGYMSTKSFSRRILQRIPITNYRSPITDALTDSGGRSLAMTDDRFDDTRYLITALRPNTNSLFRNIRSFDGYDGGIQVTKRWTEVSELFAPGSDPELTLRSRLDSVPVNLATRYGIRWLLIETVNAEGNPSRSIERSAPGWVDTGIREGSVLLLRNPQLSSEAQLIPNGRAVKNGAEAVAAVASLAENSVAVELATSVLPRCSAGSCTPEPQTLNRLHSGLLRLETTSSRDNVLRIAESYDPGWQVSIDDKPARILIVDGLQLGVAVPAGNHRITFSYRPARFVLLAAINALAALAVFILLFWGRKLGRRSTAIETS